MITFAPPVTGITLGILLIGTVLTVAAVNAETYRHGDSTTTIEQSGGSRSSQSQVERYSDGQKIITQDGNSTDITIQRDSDGTASGSGSAPSSDRSGDDDPHYFEERFSGRSPDYWSDDDGAKRFQQHMRERMQQRFSD